MQFLQAAGATIVDHHTASESFMKHLENEVSTPVLLLGVLICNSIKKFQDLANNSINYGQGIQMSISWDKDPV